MSPQSSNTQMTPPPAGGNQDNHGNSLAQHLYAGLLLRFFALLIDGLVIALPLGIILGIIGMDSALGTVGLIVAAAYYIYMHTNYGATLGKMAVSIKVTTLEGELISYEQSAKRYAPYIVFGGLGLIGEAMAYTGSFAMMGMTATLQFCWVLVSVVVLIADAQKRTLHDRIAKTVVVKKDILAAIRAETPLT